MGKKKKTIGVLMGNALSIYGKELVDGMKRAAEDKDVNIIFFLGFQGDAYRFGNTEKVVEKRKDEDYQTGAVYDYVSLGDVDALVIAYGFLSLRFDGHNKEEFLSRYKDVPCVLLNDYLEMDGFCNIKVKNYDGMFECVEHLIKTHGYRKILYLAGPRENYEARDREQAYRDAMLQNGLTVEEGMVEYGNYTSNVERQVYSLIARNPGFDAIVCANDDMAKTVYQICKAEGYTIGEDIAVTGFDDFAVAQAMDPPMTTVSQNGFGVGYESVEAAVCRINNMEPKRNTVPTSLCIRQSCGCRQKEVYQCMVSSKDEISAYIEEVSWLIADYAKTASAFSNTTVIVQRAISKLLHYISGTLVTGELHGGCSFDYVKAQIRELLHNNFTSNATVTERLCFSIRQFLPLVEDGRNREVLMELLSEVHSFVHTYDTVRLQEKLEAYMEKNSYIPSFIMEPLANLASEEMVFWDVSAKLRETQVKSSYIFLFDHPVSHNMEDIVGYKAPECMYLASYQNEDEVISYEKDQRPVIQKGAGFTQFLEKSEAHTMLAFTLFSGGVQYGMLVCETELNNIGFLHIVSLQLGVLLRFVNQR